jgi:hypothetical protein
MNALRLAEQTGAVVKQREYSTPSFASRSKLGDETSFVP